MRWQSKFFNWLILALGLFCPLAAFIALLGMIPFAAVFFAVVLLGGTVYIARVSGNL